MKRKYVRHYEDYAIGANEALYASMAEKGWRLVKRGAYFSRFQKAEPASMRYRIEFASPAWLEEAELPDEQIAVYEDCGWEFVTKMGLVHVFSAPESSDLPEFYTDPRQQAPTLKALRRSYRWSWLWTLFIVAFNLFMAIMMRGDAGRVLHEWVCELKKAYVLSTTLVLWYGALIAWMLYQCIAGAVCTMRLYRRLKRGKPIDHTLKRSQRVLRGLETAIILVGLVFLLLTAAQWIGRKQYDLPAQADGPYLLLSDFGIEGEHRSPSYARGRESEAEHVRSLLADCWDAQEYIIAPDGEDYALYQEVYRLRDDRYAQMLAEALMGTATFARRADSFREVAVPGLDRAWSLGMESVAIRGNLVWYVTFIDFDDVQTDVLTLLSKLPE